MKDGKFKDGLFTASAISKVYDKVNPLTRRKWKTLQMVKNQT